MNDDFAGLNLVELLDQFDEVGIAPSHIVVTSSSGGTHAGLLAGPQDGAPLPC